MKFKKIVFKSLLLFFVVFLLVQSDYFLMDMGIENELCSKIAELVFNLTTFPSQFLDGWLGPLVPGFVLSLIYFANIYLSCFLLLTVIVYFREKLKKK